MRGRSLADTVGMKQSVCSHPAATAVQPRPGHRRASGAPSSTACTTTTSPSSSNMPLTTWSTCDSACTTTPPTLTWWLPRPRKNWAGSSVSSPPTPAPTSRQQVDATPAHFIDSKWSLRASAGVFQPRLFRGRLLRVAATARYPLPPIEKDQFTAEQSRKPEAASDDGYAVTAR